MCRWGRSCGTNLPNRRTPRTPRPIKSCKVVRPGPCMSRARQAVKPILMGNIVSDVVGVGEMRTKCLHVAGLALAIVLGAGAASAEELNGTLKKINDTG